MMEDLPREEMSQIWRSLVELQRIDAEILAVDQRLSALPAKVDAEHQRLASKQAALRDHEARGESHARERRECERQIAEREEKVKRLQAQLFQVKTQREYDAIGVEVTVLQREISDIEDRELALIEAEETHAREIEALRRAVDELRAGTAKEISRLESLREEAERTREVLLADRPRHVSSLPDEILRRYDTLRLRFPDSAVVHAVESTCGGCRMGLVNQTMLQLNLGQRFTYCEHCSRMLVPQEKAG